MPARQHQPDCESGLDHRHPSHASRSENRLGWQLIRRLIEVYAALSFDRILLTMKMSSLLTPEQKEYRRRLGVERVLAGQSQAEVAQFLGVHVVTVSKWMHAYRQAGDAGLTRTVATGRPRFLTPEQEAQVLEWLTHKPTTFGFATDLWTAARVAKLIAQKLGVRFHPNYLREWLTKRNLSPQKPIRRAKQRDEAAIDRWLTDEYPRIKKKSNDSELTWSSLTKPV
jgi:transposase